MYDVFEPSPIDVAYTLPVISVVKATVPVASGKVIVLSAVNVPAINVNSFASATLPSKITPLDVLTVSTLFVVVVPVTCRSPKTVKSLLIVTSLGKPICTWLFVTVVSTSFVVPANVNVSVPNVTVSVVPPSEIVKSVLIAAVLAAASEGCIYDVNSIIGGREDVSISYILHE